MSLPPEDLDWEALVEELWASFPTRSSEDFCEAMDALATRRPADDAAALFERGGSRDSTGRTEEAVGLYRAALEQGLRGPRRRRAVIQLASSLRNLGSRGRTNGSVTSGHLRAAVVSRRFALPDAQRRSLV